MRNWIPAFLLVIFFSVELSAQEYPKIKFGKVRVKDFDEKVCRIDSSAHAVIIYEYGENWYDYVHSTASSFYVIRTYLVRMRVFDKEGVDAGDFSIITYSENTRNNERFVKINGFTHNLVDGKVERSKLAKADIHTTDHSKNRKKTSFALPDVRPGSIIEIEFKIRSPYTYVIDPWYFQHEYPTYWSEFVVEIPEYYIFKHHLSGYNPLYINESYDKSGVLTGSRGYTILCNRLVMKDVPAFISEAYLTTADNYKSIYSFELQNVRSKYSNQQINLTNSWERIDELLLDHFDFGKRITEPPIANKLLEEELKSCTDTLEMVELIFEKIRNHMQWDSRNRLKSYEMRKAFRDRKGSSADINLVLLNTLNWAGIESYPVVLSTRGNSFLSIPRPSIDDLNYVIACVRLNGEDLLLDATDQYTPPGMLPVRCLNGLGRLIHEKDSRWIDILPWQNKEMSTYRMEINSDGDISGTLSNKYYAYSARNFRSKLKNYNSPEAYYNENYSDNSQVMLDTFELNDVNNLKTELSENLNITFSDKLNAIGKLYTFEPMLDKAWTENPFKLENRLYPVEFPYPRQFMFLMKYELPEGMEVDQLPEPTLINLLDNAGSFTYTISNFGNTISLTNIISIDKTTFFSNEYQYLKEFYDLIISKHKEPIILKKAR